MLNALILALLLPAASPASGTWYELYEQGVQHVERSEPAAARLALEVALAARPEPGLRLRTYGLRYVDYLPHLYLAIACHLGGDLEAARRHLAAAEAAGAAAESESGRPLLEAYRTLLGAPSPQHEPGPELEQEAGQEPERSMPPSPGTPDDLPGFARFERSPVVLDEREHAELQRRVLSRCRLDPDTSPQRAPWYFHYELGVELERRGDPQRALDAFLEAARRRGDPQRQARLYGMWFTDYLPYYQIARAHAELGNWQCAADALAVSQRHDEIVEGDPEYFDLLSLLSEAEAWEDR